MLGERHGIPAESAVCTWMLERDGDSFVVSSDPNWREAEYALVTGDPVADGLVAELRGREGR
ncbi:hypothetical protein AB0B30_29945 [Streptomyces narbonensis]|uniref:Uncharacterized protein n=1 Tax=Streptomyces narbonensis TaxID=67333 RepID=A0ABV3CE23_9ACTN